MATTEKDLKAKCMDAAIQKSAEALTKGWDEVWKANNRALKEGKDGYGGSVAFNIANKGDGKANVGAKINWAESHSLKVPDMEVSIHPELFEDDKEGKDEGSK